MVARADSGEVGVAGIPRDGRSGDALPRMDWYPGDYLTDRRVLLMTLEQRGAYTDLLWHEWIDGPLPSTHAELRMLLGGITAKRFSTIWARVGPCFEERDGRLVQRRLEREKARALAQREQARTNGRRGGRPPKEPPKDDDESRPGNRPDNPPVPAGGTGLKARHPPSASSHKDTRPKPAADPPQAAVALAEHLRDAILRHSPAFKLTPAGLRGWATAIDRALRIDKRSPEDLAVVIDFAHADPAGAFWQANILSGAKLREKFDQLAAQMRRHGPAQQGQRDEEEREARDLRRLEEGADLAARTPHIDYGDPDAAFREFQAKRAKAREESA